MRVAWITDPHLNFVTDPQADEFLARVAAQHADAVMISGDIGEANTIIEYLQRIDDRLNCPIYFVLGNHDFYLGSIMNVRQQVGDLCAETSNLNYLTASEIVELTPRVGVIGHDGWADGRAGDYERSMIMMSDYHLIDELIPFSKMERLAELKLLGDQAAAHIRQGLPPALDRYEQVVLLTHVPPLRGACWHQGQISDDEWAPHFVCQAVGDVLKAIMPDYPNRSLLVLCGHTHGRGETQPLANLRILTGAADYGAPEIEQIFQFH